MSNKRKSGSKTVLTALVLAALFLPVFALGGCSLFPKEEEAIKPELIQTEKAEYVTVNPVRTTLKNEVNGDGRVKPKQQYDLVFNKIVGEGTLASMNADYGQQVKKGDILCTLDNSELADEMDIREMQYEIAKIDYNEAYKAYQAGELSYRNWLQAQISFKSATKQFNEYKEMYDTMILRSPIDGVITFKAAVTVGSSVKKGSLMYSVSDVSSLYVQYSGQGYDKIPLNAQCELTVTTVDGKVVNCKGTVVMTPMVADKTSPNYSQYTVIIQPDSSFPSESVKIDSVVTVYYLIEQKEDALTIPTSCIKQDSLRSYVYVLQDGYRQERDVVTGLVGENGYTTEIVSGLSEEDKVIK